MDELKFAGDRSMFSDQWEVHTGWTVELLDHNVVLVSSIGRETVPLALVDGQGPKRPPLPTGIGKNFTVVLPDYSVDGAAPMRFPEISFSLERHWQFIAPVQG